MTLHDDKWSRSNLEVFSLKVRDSEILLNTSLKFDVFHKRIPCNLYDTVTEEGNLKKMLKLLNILETKDISFGSGKEEILAREWC